MKQILLVSSLLALLVSSATGHEPSSKAPQRDGARPASRAATKPRLVLGPLRLGKQPLTRAERRKRRELRERIAENTQKIKNLESTISQNRRNLDHDRRVLANPPRPFPLRTEEGYRRSIGYWQSEIREAERLVKKARAEIKRDERQARRLGDP